MPFPAGLKCPHCLQPEFCWLTVPATLRYTKRKLELAYNTASSQPAILRLQPEAVSAGTSSQQVATGSECWHIKLCQHSCGRCFFPLGLFSTLHLKITKTRLLNAPALLRAVLTCQFPPGA
jgi:hypothetical protein